MRDRLLDEKGVRRFINIYVGEEDIRFLDGLETELKSGDQITHRPGDRRRLTTGIDRARTRARSACRDRRGGRRASARATRRAQRDGVDARAVERALPRSAAGS